MSVRTRHISFFYSGSRSGKTSAVASSEIDSEFRNAFLDRSQIGLDLLEHGADVDAAEVDDEAGADGGPAAAGHLARPGEGAQLGPAPGAVQPTRHRKEGGVHPPDRLHENALRKI